MKAFALILTLIFSYPPVVAGAGSTGTGGQTVLLTGVDSSGAEAIRIRPFHLEILPPSSGVQFYRDGIIFLSHSATEEKVPGNHLSFGSIKTYSSLIVDTLPGALTPFSFPDHALFPTEATTFSSDYKTMYLSLIPEKDYSEKIFRADLTASGWKLQEEPVEICNGYNIYAHPCLSSDGTFMIFSSDMDGSEGGLDLFITRREGDNWGTPENLGSQINTTGNELFASLDSRNNLYFSSDGHPGKGGYDIFISSYDGKGWGKPRNLSGQINTKADELGFTINREDDRTAFYTVRNRSGRQRTQLYIIDLKPDHTAGSESGLTQRLLAIAEDLPGTPGRVMPGAEKAIASAKSTPDKKKNGKPGDKEEIMVASATAAGTTAEAKPARESASAVTRKEIAGGKDVVEITRTAEATKAEAGESARLAAAAESPKPAARASTTPEKSTVANATTGKAEAKPVQPATADREKTAVTPAAKADVVIYRVQIIANTKAVGSQTITVAGKSYKSYEYFYMGGYRTTIGEFSQLADAARLQNLCRQNGYNQAFVVAFRNNERTNDPSLFR